MSEPHEPHVVENMVPGAGNWPPGTVRVVLMTQTRYAYVQVPTEMVGDAQMLGQYVRDQLWPLLQETE